MDVIEHIHAKTSASPDHFQVREAQLNVEACAVLLLSSKAQSFDVQLDTLVQISAWSWQLTIDTHTAKCVLSANLDNHELLSSHTPRR